MGLSGLRRFLYYPERLPENLPLPRHAAGAEEAWITTTDGETIHGLFWSPPPGRPTLLYFHGNAGHAYGWALVREDLGALDAGLLLIDYRGYGKSSGRPSERGLALDAEASLAWLEARGIGVGSIVPFGKSLGGGVAVELARGRAFLGLVLESTFTSIGAVSRHLFPVFPVGELFPDRFESAAKLGDVKSPVLVIHGRDDGLIPASEGQALFDAVQGVRELWIVAGADHNDVSWVAGAAYGTRLRSWLDGLRPPVSDSRHAV